MYKRFVYLYSYNDVNALKQLNSNACTKNYANYGIEGILLFEFSTLHHTLYTRCIFKCTPTTTDMHSFYYYSGVGSILKVGRLLD